MKFENLLSMDQHISPKKRFYELRFVYNGHRIFKFEILFHVKK